MINEILFLLHTTLVSLGALGAALMGSHALVAFVAIQAILANLLVTKQILFCGLTATTSDAFIIGSSLGINLLQEWYGKTTARKAIYISFALLLFYTLITIIFLQYHPATCDTVHPYFEAILTPMPRITLASLSVYAFVQYLEYYIFAALSALFKGRYLPLRNAISIGFCQLIDTVLFSFLALYGTVDNVMHIIIISYSIKIIATITSSFFVGLAQPFISRIRVES